MRNDENLFEKLVEQENLLRFKDISIEALSAIGERIVEMLESENSAAYIRICVNGFEIFSRAMPGTSENNRRWAMRKANTAELFQKSSFRVAIENARKGRSVEDIGLSAEDYAFEGGAFPILLSSGLCIGSIAVSGLPSECDHQMICSAVAEYLDAVAPSIND